MGAPKTVIELVERFERNIESYKNSGYNETQVRREFVDPLFAALGWDVDNTQGYAEAYKDVIHEDAIKIGSATKAPDYCFRIGGTRKFFLEAKKPSIDIKSDPSPAYQLRRYGWSAKLPLSILTDFEEFAVYDCRSRPVKTDKSSKSRILYLAYTDYIEKWDEIAAIFSREAVLKGSFDKYADTAKGKRGTQEVDASFLAEIELWREALAKNIALRNPALNHRELNFAVQLTIDRIIFLRICEDRGIERYGELLAMINGEAVYDRLLGLFRKADDRYNSGLFHFTTEKGRHDPPDELTPGLVIDDKILKDMFKRMYYPDSPFEFSVLPAEILGQVYEQFLGSTITLTAGHRARVENKPEVKKAGGVFYTPAYIVDYIVENTVGKLVEGKTPKQVRKIKILDPACGSGSFLLGAYQFLLDWHLQYYLDNDPQVWAKKKDPPVCSVVKGSSGILPESQDAASNKLLPCEGEVAEGRRGLSRLSHPPASRITPSPLRGTPPSQGESFKLTLTERKRILLDCLYGVDIDSQAVEVTKLSLLLKVLEGEKQITLFATERALPDLCDNIKCGNSLIGPDFYKNQQLALFDDEMHYKINAFDWQKEFPHIFKTKTPGFDAVIGNPPYRMLQPHNTEEDILAYLKSNFVAAEFKIELFHLFYQKAVTLLKNGGHHGYIIPTTILNNVYAEALRQWIMNCCSILSIAVAKDRVFATADVHTSIIISTKESDSKKRNEHKILTCAGESKEFNSITLPYSNIRQLRFDALPGHVWNILINEDNANLITRLNKEFAQLKSLTIINRGLITGSKDKYFSDKKISETYVPIIAGSDVQRYNITPYSQYVLFERPKTSGGCWDKDVHLAKHKLVIRQIGYKPTASILTQPIAVTGNIFTIRADNIEEEKYILGIINSKLIEFYWKVMFTDFKSSFPQVTIFSLSQIPIRTIDFSNKTEKRLHDELVSLVEGMLGLHEKLAAARTGDAKTRLQRQIEATDSQIDRLVYDLYGLTEEEIAIVEGAN